MNGVPAGASSVPARSLTMPAQPDAAGDQITGGGPLASGLGQPSTISWAAAPDALRAGRTNTHPLFGIGALAVVEVVGELGQQGDLLAADRHVDTDAVARIAVGEIVGVAAASSSPPRTRRDRERGDDGDRQPTTRSHRRSSQAVTNGEQ